MNKPEFEIFVGPETKQVNIDFHEKTFSTEDYYWIERFVIHELNLRFIDRPMTSGVIIEMRRVINTLLEHLIRTSALWYCSYDKIWKLNRSESNDYNGPNFLDIGKKFF